MSVKLYKLKPEYSYAKGSFFFVLYPDGRLDLNFGQYENQVDAGAAELFALTNRNTGFPRYLYVKDLINVFELGRAVGRGEAEPYKPESEGF